MEALAEYGLIEHTSPRAAAASACGVIGKYLGLSGAAMYRTGMGTLFRIRGGHSVAALLGEGLGLHVFVIVTLDELVSVCEMMTLVPSRLPDSLWLRLYELLWSIVTVHVPSLVVAWKFELLEAEIVTE
jgi:hypothetical protein